VAAFVGRLPNSIGYVERLRQTEQDDLCPAAQFDEYLCERTTPASKPLQRVADWAKTQRDRQPTGCVSPAPFILMQKCRTTSTDHSRFESFFEWAYKGGDKTADDLDYDAHASNRENSY
jgi:phosphate transport system substrate-binding protein